MPRATFGASNPPRPGIYPLPKRIRAQMSAKLGEILVRENLISPQHLREALDYQREHGGRLGFNLVKLGTRKRRHDHCRAVPAVRHTFCQSGSLQY